MKLNRPWMVAVWPGMGHVAISAGYYLMAKLEMHLLAEFSARELFEVEFVEVQHGLVRTGRLPQSRLFVWKDPNGERDIIVFLGEAQPLAGKYAFCRRLIEYSRELGVERVFTFAAMATEMLPRDDSRVFGAAADEGSLSLLREMEVEILQEARIGGLNGVLLGAAADSGMPGACLLGELPQMLAQLPFPKAALAVLSVFTAAAELDLDLQELEEQSHALEDKLGELLDRVEEVADRQSADEHESFDEMGAASPSGSEEENMGEDARRLEALFEKAKEDRSCAYELKRELDRLGKFSQYEDRFLDLFRNPG